MTKIKRYRLGHVVDNGITLDGPGLENRPCVSLGAAIAMALDLADRARHPFTVREYGDAVVQAVPHEQGGSYLAVPA